MRNRAIAFFSTLVLSVPIWGQQALPPGAIDSAPTRPGIQYGDSADALLDLWLVSTDGSSPIAIYFHGQGGDKDTIVDEPGLKSLLDAGISIASVTTPGRGAEVRSHGKQALRFLREHADELSIDATRIATFGRSMGAGVAMSLAFTDQAELQAMRVKAVGTIRGQALDARRWLDEISVWPADVYEQMFGNSTPSGEDRSVIEYLSADDPPLYMEYAMSPNDPPPDASTDPGLYRNWLIHHVEHGLLLKARADALGVEAYLNYPGEQSAFPNIASFLIDKLQSN